ncbi:MAG: penicillin acylase family protein [Deltaproteobacteria bacterium]|nr:penicillin acylase family protein [Deltaproteobacteria bacterium]
METLPYPGDAQTVNAGGYRPGMTYDTQYYSALRFLIDMGDPGEARVSFPGGQSENANHPAYSNMFDAWYEVQDYQLLYDADDLAAATMAARIRLEPGE